MKIKLDKYYTPINLAEHCLSVTKNIIGEENITEYLEPSAGAGVFLDFFDKPYLAFDIEPEDKRVVEQDFLGLDLPYKKGRCIIGNPPFGIKNYLTSVTGAFYKKSVLLGDYIAFVLPISQYKTNRQLFEFDLIHSELLPESYFSGVKMVCCFNIYKRPKDGLNKKAIKYKFGDIKTIDFRRGTTKIEDVPIDYVFGMCTWGAALDKPVKYVGEYAQEFYVYVLEKSMWDAVSDVMVKTDWYNLYPHTASPRLANWKLAENVKGIK